MVLSLRVQVWTKQPASRKTLSIHQVIRLRKVSHWVVPLQAVCAGRMKKSAGLQCKACGCLAIETIETVKGLIDCRKSFSGGFRVRWKRAAHRPKIARESLERLLHAMIGQFVNGEPLQTHFQALAGFK